MPEYVDNKNCPIKLNIEDSKLKAFIKITAPLESDFFCTYDEIMKILTDHKIVFGIQEMDIKKALQERRWGQYILAAEGIAPIEGRNAELIYEYQTNNTFDWSNLQNAASVDFHDLNLVQNVKKGDLLVRKIPLIPGTDGMDIMGTPLISQPPKDIGLPKGKNTAADETGQCLYADIDGHVSIIDGKVSITEVYTVSGDVDYSSGNIDFIGSVVVNGNVNSGFRVYAGGDIEIKGSVSSAEVKARGSIMVQGGITGGMKGTITAGENIMCRFIENAFVEAGQNVMVKEAIIQSHVKAGQSIKVTNNKAIIVGGLIQAGEKVESKVLGSQLATQTLIEVGVNPYMKDQYQLLAKKQTEKEKELTSISQNLQVIQRSGLTIENLNEKRKAALIKLLDHYQVLRNELQEIDSALKEIMSQLTRYQSAEIKVMDVVYPGVRVTMGDLIYIVNDPVRYARFIIDAGEIKLTSLR